MVSKRTSSSRKLDLLKKVTLFATLKESGMEVVARNSGLYSFKKGDVIFREGSYGEGLYVVSEGEVLITRQTAEKETINIAQFIRGESFGEMDLLEGRVMPATAIAETDAVILIFPEGDTRFQDVLSPHPELSAQILHELLATIAGRIRTTNRLISEKSQWVGDLKRPALLRQADRPVQPDLSERGVPCAAGRLRAVDGGHHGEAGQLQGYQRLRTVTRRATAP